MLTACSPLTIPEATIYASKNSSTSKQDELIEVLEKAEKTGQLTVTSYKDELFPNQLICSLTNLEDLTLDNRIFVQLKNDTAISGRITIKPLRLSTCVDSLRYLKTLTFTGVEFKSFPLELSRLSSLETLVLKECELGQLPEDLTAFEGLKKLVLDKNRFTGYPRSLRLPESLEEFKVYLDPGLHIEQRIKIWDIFPWPPE